ncbi:MAG: prolipoprotein diacylglyceryl transferase [Lysobacterales bacterium]
MNAALLHGLFELLAYGAGFRLFLYLRRREPAHPLADTDHALWIGSAAIIGAALGSRMLWWLEDPATAFAHFPHPLQLISGKTVAGGFIGGWLAVEAIKRWLGDRRATGDLLVYPLLLGLAIGRLGCFLAGVEDGTAGSPTDLPWAWDYGDGIPRHPAQLYEIGFCLTLAALLAWRGNRLPRPGDRFKLFMVAYLGWRVLVEFLKPLPYAWFGVLSGIQIGCALALLIYLPHIPRLFGALLWAPRPAPISTTTRPSRSAPPA